MEKPQGKQPAEHATPRDHHLEPVGVRKVDHSLVSMGPMVVKGPPILELPNPNRRVCFGDHF